MACSQHILHQGYLRKNVFDENPYKVVQWSHVGVTDKSFLCIVAVPPVCQPKGVKVYGVAKMETAHIACNVEANPLEVSFRLV